MKERISPALRLDCGAKEPTSVRDTVRLLREFLCTEEVGQATPGRGNSMFKESLAGETLLYFTTDVTLIRMM